MTFLWWYTNRSNQRLLSPLGNEFVNDWVERLNLCHTRPVPCPITANPNHTAFINYIYLNLSLQNTLSVGFLWVWSKTLWYCSVWPRLTHLSGHMEVVLTLDFYHLPNMSTICLGSISIGKGGPPDELCPPCCHWWTKATILLSLKPAVIKQKRKFYHYLSPILNMLSSVQYLGVEPVPGSGVHRGITIHVFSLDITHTWEDT